MNGEKCIKSLSDYEKMVEVMGEYDNKIDYVGPRSNQRMTKLIPRYLPGNVDINAAAYRHDYAYEIGGNNKDRFHADSAFLTDMLNLINEKQWTFVDMLRFLPYRTEKRAWLYYKSVRITGKNHFKYK